MNGKSELITVFKRKIEELHYNIRVLENAADVKDSELKSEGEIRDSLVQEVVFLMRKIGVLENDFYDTEKKLQEAKIKWEEMRSTAEECERARRGLQICHEADDNRVYQLELLVKEATDQASDAEYRYEDVSRKLMNAENMLESRELEYAKTEKQLREVTVEFNIICNSLKILETNELKGADLDKLYHSEICKLKKQLNEAEQRAHMSEVDLTQLQVILDELEDAIHKQKRNHMLLQSDVQRMVDEL